MASPDINVEVSIAPTPTVEVSQAASPSVTVQMAGAPGPQGPAGPQGATGPRGTDGTGDATFQQDFNLQSTVTVVHNLSKYPSVTVMNSAHEEVQAAVEYESLSTLTVFLAGTMSGSVICN